MGFLRLNKDNWRQMLWLEEGAGGGGGPVFIRETERKMRRGTRKKGGREESVEEAMENQGAPRSRGRI